MTPERWRQVEAILQSAIDCPQDERVSFVDDACRGDHSLKSETLSLLKAHDEAGEFIEQPAIAEDARLLTTATLDLNIGRTIGHYKIIEWLGAGGMGEVYLAQDARLGRQVALKILPSYFVFDENRLRRFQREARAASALNHPNIITIHEVGELEGDHFIATEFIDGRTLGSLNATNSLSLKEILDISIQVGSAMAAAHAAGIVHRDIKPENIMLRSDGIVKILDFGIAKLTEQRAAELSSEAPTVVKSQTETGVVMGTPRYMSPEQARGLALDERTDIWSFGVVLYELIAGSAPFARATQVDTLVEILEREPPPLTHYVETSSSNLTLLQVIVNKALSKDRNERFSSASEMVDALDNARRDLDLEAVLYKRPASEFLYTDSSRRPETERVEGQRVVTRTSVAEQPKVTGLQHRTRFSIYIVTALVVVVIAGAILYSRFGTRVSTSAPAFSANPVTKKLYSQMNDAEQLAFIDEQEQKISAMIGDRPVKLNDDALRAIKQRVDKYVSRIGSVSDEPGKEDLRVIYSRAVPFIPLITRSFAERKVPIIIGIYLPVIESEYKTCFENSIGAKGLYQFIPQTAALYGVSHEEMCNVEKMTPAAAHFIADRMAELGEDSQSMTLVLLSYNIGEEAVRDALRDLRDTKNYERTFWTLFANREKFGQRFRSEGSVYVPNFFAAAIIGENPQAFELPTQPLSKISVAVKP